MFGAEERAAWMRSNLSGSEPAENTLGRTGLTAECILAAHDEHVLLLEHVSHRVW